MDDSTDQQYRIRTGDKRQALLRTCGIRDQRRTRKSQAPRPPCVPGAWWPRWSTVEPGRGVRLPHPGWRTPCRAHHFADLGRIEGPTQRQIHLERIWTRAATSTGGRIISNGEERSEGIWTSSPAFAAGSPIIRQAPRIPSLGFIGIKIYWSCNQTMSGRKPNLSTPKEEHNEAFEFDGENPARPLGG